MFNKIVMKSIFLFGLLVIVSLGSCTIQEQEKPNILWIVADDLGPDLGCYGNKSIHTPSLDKLALESIKFTELHTVTAVCSPSRSALITGMYPCSIDCHQHRTKNKKNLPEGVKPITEYFKEAGYFVSNGDATKPGMAGKTDYNFVGEDSVLFDGIDWNQREAGQPFFAQMQIHFPHRPFKADTINPVNREKLKIPPIYPNHPVVKEDWALYLESIQWVDGFVGKLMDRLEKEGLLKNTVVMFFGDQGRPMVRAKQFLYDAGTRTPFLLRLPNGELANTIDTNLYSNIDISATSLKLAGIKVPSHIQGRDILSDSKREVVFSMRDRRDETVDRIRSVRSKQYKYIKNYYPEKAYTQFNAYKVWSYPTLALMKVMHKKGELKGVQESFMQASRPKEELYNVVEDPYEMNNLASHPEYNDVLEKHRMLLESHVAAYDKGVYPEDEKEIAYWSRFMHKMYIKRMNKYGLDEDCSDEELLDYWQKKLGVAIEE
ncbi:sulfatase [Labilibacter sediminis]|nr:sulfatase [Labilibacter sediminis]